MSIKLIQKCYYPQQNYFTVCIYTRSFPAVREIIVSCKTLLLSSHEEYWFSYMCLKGKQYKLKCGESVAQESSY